MFGRFSDTDALRRSSLAGFAIRTGWWRAFKLLRGYWRTYLDRRRKPYDPDTWWEAWHRSADLSDAGTIDPGINELVARYHYATIETLILRELHGIGVPGRVLDLGSGAGHWLTFYSGLGAEVTGLDISAEAVRRLRAKYPLVHQGNISELNLTDFDAVNVIGVMFHIVDDDAHKKAIAAIGRSLKSGGVLIVGGGFPFATVDVQFDSTGCVNKRLRSRRYWRRQLVDWQEVRFIRNRAARQITAVLPESDLLIAIR